MGRLAEDLLGPVQALGVAVMIEEPPGDLEAEVQVVGVVQEVLLQPLQVVVLLAEPQRGSGLGLGGPVVADELESPGVGVVDVGFEKQLAGLMVVRRVDRYKGRTYGGTPARTVAQRGTSVRSTASGPVSSAPRSDATDLRETRD
jgi:hypothetical protein